MFGFDPRNNQFISQSGGAIFDLAARTAAPTTIPEMLNPGFPGIRVDVHATAKTATPSVTFKIQRWIEAQGAWVDILTSAALTDAGDLVLKVTAALAASANVTASEQAPGKWRVLPVHADGDSLTYAVSYEYLTAGGVFTTAVA